MNNDIKFLNREWRTRYSLTNFEDHFWIASLSYFLDPNMCGFQYIWKVIWSPSDTKLQWSIGRTNCLHYSTRVDLYCHQTLNFMQLHGHT